MTSGLATFRSYGAVVLIAESNYKRWAPTELRNGTEESARKPKLLDGTKKTGEAFTSPADDWSLV